MAKLTITPIVKKGDELIRKGNKKPVKLIRYAFKIYFIISLLLNIGLGIVIAYLWHRN